MEIFIRIAYDKYVKSGQTSFVYEAVRKILYNDGLFDALREKEDPTEWRESKLFKNEVEAVFKLKTKNLIKLYHMVCDLRELTQFSSKQFITVRAFVTFLA